MPAHHLADRVLAAARDELQLRNERRAEAMLSGQTRELPQFANGPGDVRSPVKLLGVYEMWLRNEGDGSVEASYSLPTVWIGFRI